MTYDPQYDPENHTYTWYIEHLSAVDPNAPGDPNEVLTLTVTVNNTADPMGVIVNKVEATGPVYRYAEVRTPVGCFGGDVIYVDGSKPVGGNGTSWARAYDDLQAALTRAGKGCGTEIWVAAGTYKPGTAYNSTFEIPDGISVYGGFAGNETTLEDRNWKIHKTILSGYIGKDEFQNDLRNETVVTMDTNSLLDGVVIRDAGIRGIEGIDKSFLVMSCQIQYNGESGIHCENGNLTLRWSDIDNNGKYGIYHHGQQEHYLSISNCRIYDNQQDGIRSVESAPQIRNTTIFRNGFDTQTYGINIGNPYSSPVIHNNTVAHNFNQGINCIGSNVPDIRNCILWYNNDDGQQLAGYGVTHYSCVFDPNDPQGTNYSLYGDHNFSGKPGFAYDYEPYGFYHLNHDSECRNAGDNTFVEQDEVDIDGDERIADNTVDIGSDEVDCEDTTNDMDWSADGVVNFVEWVKFSHTWMTYDPNNPLCDPNNPNYEHDPNSINFISQTDKERFDAVCDLDDDLDVDLDDMMMFAEDWLWVACWRDSQSLGFLYAISGMSNSVISEGTISIDSIPETASTQSIQDLSAKSLRQEIFETQETVNWLETLWLSNPDVRTIIDHKAWQNFMDQVYDGIRELEISEIKLINPREAVR
jgi:hypothetical protein